MSRTGPLDQAKAAAAAAPTDPEKQTRYALAALRAGEEKAARTALRKALKSDPKFSDAIWIAARLALREENLKAARERVRQLLAGGHDGYEVQLLLSKLELERGDRARATAALEAAHRLDPTMADPLRMLADLARKHAQPDQELSSLRKLAKLEQHDPGVYRRLMRLLLERKLIDEALEVGQSALYADMNGLRTHQAFADVLTAAGQVSRAVYELESAVLCPGRPKEQADAHAQLAETLLLSGKRRAARRHAKEARRLDPSNPRLAKLRL
jgi:tetratricopeptide (TPR) repeat protein